jgi:hypothetical protein
MVMATKKEKRSAAMTPPPIDPTRSPTLPGKRTIGRMTTIDSTSR